MCLGVKNICRKFHGKKNKYEKCYHVAKLMTYIYIYIIPHPAHLNE